MKRFIYMLSIAGVLCACKKTQTTPEVKSPYPDIAVGKEEGGKYIVENDSIIKSEWQAKFQGSIESLQIVKSETTDDAHAGFYMLLAKTPEGGRMATILTEKNKQLFFEDNGIITLCKSLTAEDFNIKGLSQDGHVRLYCADCADCEKTEYGL